MKRPQVGWLLDLPDFHFPPAALLLFSFEKVSYSLNWNVFFFGICKLLRAKPLGSF
jgi:hypothetical protein